MATFLRSSLSFLLLFALLDISLLASAETPSSEDTVEHIDFDQIIAESKKSIGIILETLEHCDSPTKEQSGYIVGYLKGKGSLSGILKAGLSQTLPGAAAGGLAGAAVGASVMLPTAMTSLSLDVLPIVGPAALIGLGLGAVGGASIKGSQAAGKIDGDFEISGRIEGKQFNRLTHEQLHFCAVFDFENFEELEKDVSEAESFQKKNSVENLKIIMGDEYLALLEFRKTFALYIEKFSDLMISKSKYVEFVNAARKLQKLRQALVLNSLDAVDDDVRYTSLTRLIEVIEKYLSQSVRFVMLNVPTVEIKAHRFADLKIYNNSGYQFVGASQFVANNFLEATRYQNQFSQGAFVYGNEELIKDCKGYDYISGYVEMHYREDPGFDADAFNRKYKFKKENWVGHEYMAMGIMNKEWPSSLSYSVQEKLYLTASRKSSDLNSKNPRSFIVMSEDEFLRNYGAINRKDILAFDTFLEKQIALGQEVFIGKL